MKKTIITALIAVAAVTAKAQAAHQTFTADPNAIVQFDGLRLKSMQVNNFLVVAANGIPAIQSSEKLSGAQITGMLKDYATVVDSLAIRYQIIVSAAKTRWAADTAKIHPKTK